jgi:hypothetical protein
MKILLTLFGKTIKEIVFTVLFIGLVVTSFWLALYKAITWDTFLILLCILIDSFYLSIVLTPKQSPADRINKLLMENKNSGSPVSLMQDLDQLTNMLKTISKLDNNNNKQILKD